MFIKRVPFAADVVDNGVGGSEITMYFPERYYEKYDTIQIAESKQQVIVLHAPVRKSDKIQRLSELNSLNCWEAIL